MVLEGHYQRVHHVLVAPRHLRPACLTPITVCSRMVFHSSTSRTPILLSTSCGTLIFPMSWNRAATPSFDR